MGSKFNICVSASLLINLQKVEEFFLYCRPTTNAIMGLTFAKYVVQPFFPGCDVPQVAIVLIATITICK